MTRRTLTRAQAEKMIDNIRIEPISDFVIQGDKSNYIAWVDGEENFVTTNGVTMNDARNNMIEEINELIED